MEVPIIINHQIKSKKVKRKMESSITKIVIKKVLEKMGDCPLEKLPVRYGPSHFVLTFTDDPPPPSSEAPALPSPRKNVPSLSRVQLYSR